MAGHCCLHNPFIVASSSGVRPMGIACAHPWAVVVPISGRWSHDQPSPTSSGLQALVRVDGGGMFDDSLIKTCVCMHACKMTQQGCAC
jgi:hypothetical protein